jgi:hypothetical protein
MSAAARALDTIVHGQRRQQPQGAEKQAEKETSAAGVLGMADDRSKQ